MWPISELPLTAVADFPPSGHSNSKSSTTPRIWKHVSHLRSSSSSSSSSSDPQKNQGPAPLVIRSRRRYIFPVHLQTHRSIRKKQLTTPFHFEVYPSRVFYPFTMSPTPTPASSAVSDGVEKYHVKSSEFVFFLPVLLMLGTILLLGVILLCMRRKQRLDEIRHKLIPVYHFAPGDEEEWGVLLKDEDLNLSKSKNQRKF